MYKHIEQEQRRLAEENQARLAYYITHHVSQINQLLKCSICCDVYDRPTTVFHCSHVFCEDCIKTYLEFSITKEPPCPICQKPIPRNNLRPHDVFAKVAKFANFASERIEKTFGCSASQPPSFGTILAKIKAKNYVPQAEAGGTSTNKTLPDYSLILKARKILICPNKEVISSVEEIPREIPSVSFRDGSLKTPTLNKRNIVINTKDSSLNKKDLFDTIKESPVIHPLFKTSKLNEVTKTYTIKKQPKETTRNIFADKVIDFEDNSNKMKILQWLNDSRNKFDSFPTTQQKNIPVSHTQFDLPSVSQLHKQKANPVHASQINKQKLEQNKIRQKSELVVHLSRIDLSAGIFKDKNDNRRTRSLENYINAAKQNKKLKRHSITVAEKITIDQFNSEEEINDEKAAIVNLIEEECLNNIEAEVKQGTKTKMPTKHTEKLPQKLDSPKRSKRLTATTSKEIDETKKPLNVSSGWARIKEIKKTIRKLEIKPNKLVVSGVSRSSNVSSTLTEPDASKIKGKIKPREPIVILERMKFPINTKKDSKAYDLNVVESYFSKNLANTEMASISVSPNKKHSGKKNILSPNKVLITAEIHDSKGNSVSVKEKVKTNGEKKRNNSKQVEKDNSKLLNLDEIIEVSDGQNSTSTNNSKRATRSKLLLPASNKSGKEALKLSKANLDEIIEASDGQDSTSSRTTLNQENESKIVTNSKSSPSSNKVGLPTSCKSRKRLFNDDRSENEIKSLINNKSNDELKKKKKNELVVSPSDSLLKEARTKDLDIEQKSKLDLQKTEKEKITTPNNSDPNPKDKIIYDFDDDLFMLPTQDILGKENPTEKIQSDEDIFLIPTQVIDIVQEDNKAKILEDILKQKIQALQTIFNTPNFISEMKAHLNDIQQTLSNQEPTIEKSKNDTETQTEFNEYSQDVTTQTVFPEETHKNAAMQTESCDSSKGFRISSTDQFHTQPVTNTEMQTDDMVCPKCSFVLENKSKIKLLTNPTAISSQALLRDSNIIKSLSAKYVLSETFDGIDFETQDVVKGKGIKGSSSLLKGSVVQKENKELMSQNKPKLPQSSTFVSPAEQCFKTPTKKSYKRIRKASSDSDSNDELSKTVKKNKFIQHDLSFHFASELQTEIVNPNVENAELILSGDSEGIDYGQYLQNVLKKCDEDLMPKKSTQKSTQMEPPAPPKRSKTQDIIEECRLILQEACSDAITFENTENINTVKEIIPKPSKLTLTTMEEEFQHDFNDDLMEIDKNERAKVESTNKLLSESLFSSADNFSKSIIPVPTLPPLQVKPHNRSKIGKINDEANRLLTQEPLDELIDVLDEFDGSFEETVDQNKNNTAIKAEDPKKQIKILQNIVIDKDNPPDTEHLDNIEDKGNESDDVFFSDSDIVETTPQKSKPASIEQLSLLSQAYYDAEEKIILPPLIDESPDIITSLDPPIATCLGKVFVPPPEFQDTASNNHTVTDNESVVDLITQQELTRIAPAPSASLTPDLCLPQTHELIVAVETKEPFVTSTQYANDSQILPSKSLNLSPIRGGSLRAINPILAAQNSKFSPLNVVKSITPPPPQRRLVATSTPKQKSILNYVRGNETSQYSQKSVTERTTMNKKSCLACTRMNKEQLLAITSLAKRKLIIYSNVFSSTVTHMIVDVDEHNRVKDHTMKYVCAVAAGIWVLNFTWVEECLKQNRILPEEPFEALDMSGIAGPKTSRLMGKTYPLLKGYKIHVVPVLRSTSIKEVENVIKVLGGEVATRLDDLMPSSGKVCLIITEIQESEDSDMYETWLEMLKVATVDLEWLSRSVGRFQKLSLRPFAMCSEESICDLGYPAELVAEGPLSFSHTT